MTLIEGKSVSIFYFLFFDLNNKLVVSAGINQPTRRQGCRINQTEITLMVSIELEQ